MLTVTVFPFQNRLHFLRVVLKDYKSLSDIHFRDIKCVCFLYDQWPCCWHWMTPTNVLSYFCCQIIFWIIITFVYFFNQSLHISRNNVCHFVRLYILINFLFIIFFWWHYNFTKDFIFTYFFISSSLFSLLEELR